MEESSLHFWRCQGWPEEHCPCRHGATWNLPMWIGPMCFDYKSHLHVTVVKKSLINPLFKGWGEWKNCKIKIQTLLPFYSNYKLAFPIDQITPQCSVNTRLGQVHSHWTSLEIIHSPLQRGKPAWNILKAVCFSQEGWQVHFREKDALER